MKLYNIDNTGKFFEKLAACQGEVEFVDEKSGCRISLPKQGIQEILPPLSLIHGGIKQIELLFHDHRDFDNIFRWVINKGGISA